MHATLFGSLKIERLPGKKFDLYRRARNEAVDCPVNGRSGATTSGCNGLRSVLLIDTRLMSN